MKKVDLKDLIAEIHIYLKEIENGTELYISRTGDMDDMKKLSNALIDKIHAKDADLAKSMIILMSSISDYVKQNI